MIDLSGVPVDELADMVRGLFDEDSWQPTGKDRDGFRRAALDELVRRANLPWSYREANARADASEKTVRFKI